MPSYSCALIATSLAAVLAALPAQAQVARTFVSATGSDANNCANVATPCRHFQNAVNATTPGGEVVALDPANYGSMTISHQITINGQGWAYVAPPNGGNAITINAGSGDNVTIHGVVLDGVGATGGTNGIVFNAGGSFTVTDCVVQNFAGATSATGNGFYISPTSSTVDFTITNTTVTNNTGIGIYYTPFAGSHSANGIIDRVTATGNAIGIDIFTNNATGGATVVAISNTIAGNNSGTGIFGNNGSVTPLTLSIDNAAVSGNANGISASGTAKVYLGRSVITGNSIGLTAITSFFFTYKDNRINLNTTTDISGPVTTAVLQ